MLSKNETVLWRRLERLEQKILILETLVQKRMELHDRQMARLKAAAAVADSIGIR